MRTMEQYRALVNEALPSALRSLGAIPDPLWRAMDYSLEAGGKRLRPALLLAACESADGAAADALPFAAALEMIHTYSLIHDDLPAMDNDDLRRGRPTSHVVFGEGLAVLAGDGLLSAAMELMLRAALGREDTRGLRAAEVIARRAGVTGMVAGQTVDVMSEGLTPTEERVAYIHTHKTADLLAAPVEAGLILAGAPEERIAAGAAYGRHLGLAFQMVDDLLDVEGDEVAMGKRTGLDAKSGKQTWVALRGCRGTREDAEEQVRLACQTASGLGVAADFFRDLAQSTLLRVQ